LLADWLLAGAVTKGETPANGRAAGQTTLLHVQRGLVDGGKGMGWLGGWQSDAQHQPRAGVKGCGRGPLSFVALSHTTWTEYEQRHALAFHRESPLAFALVLE
jgi:hypothetical protein